MQEKVEATVSGEKRVCPRCGSEVFAGRDCLEGMIIAHDEYYVRGGLLLFSAV